MYRAPDTCRPWISAKHLNVNACWPYHINADNLSFAALRCAFEKRQEDTKHAHHAPASKVGHDVQGERRLFR